MGFDGWMRLVVHFIGRRGRGRFGVDEGREGGGDV